MSKRTFALSLRIPPHPYYPLCGWRNRDSTEVCVDEGGRGLFKITSGEALRDRLFPGKEEPVPSLFLLGEVWESDGNTALHEWPLHFLEAAGLGVLTQAT